MRFLPFVSPFYSGSEQPRIGMYWAICSLVHSFARTTELIRLLAHSHTHFWICGKVNDYMSQNDLVLSHSAFSLTRSLSSSPSVRVSKQPEHGATLFLADLSSGIRNLNLIRFANSTTFDSLDCSPWLLDGWRERGKRERVVTGEGVVVFFARRHNE